MVYHWEDVKISRGLTLQYSKNYESAFKVQGVCQKCGEVCFSVPKKDLSSLAEMINPLTFHPEPHTCKQNQDVKEKTLAERLEDIIIEFIDEYSYRGE